MADVSRLVLTHPALGTTGGAGLHASIEAIYAKIGNNISTRILTAVGLANAATATVEHSMKTAFGEFRYDLYLYNTATLALTRVTSATSPSLSQFTIIANVTNPTTHIDITNNSGATRDLALVLIVDPLFLKEGDIKDVDITTTPPGDGEALVWDSAGSKFKPGASGDASFKVQSVATDGTIVVKGGYLIGDDGIEYATYDGAGTASTDYGTDLSFDLDTLVLSPVNSTTYYLYVDKTLLSASVTLSDNGRQLIGITGSHFVAVTTVPKVMLLDRYIPIGFVRYATAAWSATIFGTLAFRRHQSSSTAVINYILESDFENGATSGWATYLDAAGVVPVDGTAGSPVSTFASSSSSPLRGTHSGLFTKGAANRQGEGFSVDFTIATADKSLPLVISWEGLASANYTGSSGTEFMSVYVYDVTNATLIYPASTVVAQGSSKGKSFFVASTSTSYRLIFHVAGTGTSAWTYQIDSVSVGPQSLGVGTANPDSAVTTNTPAGFGSTNTRIRRFTLANGTTVGTGITYADTAANGASFTINRDGIYSITWNDSSSIADNLGLSVNSTQLTTDIRSITNAHTLAVASNQIAGSGVAEVTYVGRFVVGDVIRPHSSDGALNGASAYSKFTITQLSIGGTNQINADRAVEEFASNSSTTTTADTTSFVYGPAGSPSILGTTSLSGIGPLGVRKRLRFQTSILSTDVFIIEFQKSTTQPWFEVGSGTEGFYNYIDKLHVDVSQSYGIGLDISSISGTDIDMNLGRYPAARGTATYGDGSVAWDNAILSTARIRVRKIAGGANVGFPVSSANIVGRIDGLAPGAGMVGEKQEVSLVSTTVATPTENTIYDTTGTLPLTPGVWSITAKVNMQADSTSVGNNRIPWLMAILRDGANNIITQAGFNHIDAVTVATPGFVGTLNLNAYVSIAATTSYKVSLKWRNASGGTITVSSFSALDDSAAGAYYGEQYIRAVRIA